MDVGGLELELDSGVFFGEEVYDGEILARLDFPHHFLFPQSPSRHGQPPLDRIKRENIAFPALIFALARPAEGRKIALLLLVERVDPVEGVVIIDHIADLAEIAQIQTFSSNPHAHTVP